MPKKPKGKTIRQVVIVDATPHQVYATLMDSKKHAKLTGARASISRKVGGKFTAYDGWIEGRNLTLVADKKIVQSWHADDWDEGVDSKLTITLAKTKIGTKLTMVHSGVPASEVKNVTKGWKEYYWAPLKAIFEK